MTALEGIQAWYLAQCDGVWEHDHGVRIETLDNPGWSVRIDVKTSSERPFQATDERRSETDWIVCRVNSGVFEACGGHGNLAEILSGFLEWQQPPTQRSPSVPPQVKCGSSQLTAYGVPDGDERLESPVRLEEVTLVATPDALREVAAFLIRAADLMDLHGEAFGHEHLRSFCRGLTPKSADIIISRG